MNLLRPTKKNTSTHITDPHILDAFNAKPTNPYLVSFPRTGSHWLRILCEHYFNRPTLTRVFFDHNNDDYLFLHTHDLDLNVQRHNIIYLYRNPIDTIYSQLRYHQTAFDDTQEIMRWSRRYGQHLEKWLHTERFTTHKTVLCYEHLRDNLATEFAKLTAHFGQILEAEKLATVAQQVTHQNRKNKNRARSTGCTVERRLC